MGHCTNTDGSDAHAHLHTIDIVETPLGSVNGISPPPNDWFGNLLNSIIFQMIGSILVVFTPLLNLLGMHKFFYTTMSGFAETMYPPNATSWNIVFN